MSDDGAAVEKKGRGRQTKAVSEEVKEPKKRGRAAAEKSPVKDSSKKEDGEVPAKRGRGRPKGTGKKAAAAKPKAKGTGKGRGRPKKEEKSEEEEEEEEEGDEEENGDE